MSYVSLAWQRDAACRGMDPLLFFGPDDETADDRKRRERRAADVCLPCPVRVGCLDYALDVPVGHGVWGGVGQSERALERRRRIRNTRERDQRAARREGQAA